MRVLLDNCIPERFARHIAPHDVRHALALGWGKLKDGPLLDVAEGKFDAIITVDTSLQYQQRIVGRPFAIIVLRPVRNRLALPLPLVPALLKTIDAIKPGEVREISPP